MSDLLPIFPLPNVGLFPNVFLPLHIFEARYREMVAVALASGRMRGIRPASLSQEASEASASIASSALGGDVSETTTATVAQATTPAQAVALVLGSPEFQKR